MAMEFEEKEPKDFIKKKQFELSDSEVEFLGANQYSEQAWEAVGRRHGVNVTTREAIPNTRNRAYLANPKLYPPVVLDMAQATAKTDSFINTVPIPSSHVRGELARRNLTLPVSDETTTEDV